VEQERLGKRFAALHSPPSHFHAPTFFIFQTGQAKTQLIAHDKEVYDIAFAPSTDVFASAGADGSENERQSAPSRAAPGPLHIGL